MVFTSKFKKDAISVNEAFHELFKDAEEVYGIIAYVKREGAEFLKEMINRYLKRKNSLVKLIVGLQTTNPITEPDALRVLKNIKKVNIKVYRNDGLHAKVFIAKKKNRITVLCGSSNLTKSALKSNLEANVLIDILPKETSYDTIINWFNLCYNGSNAQKLTNDILEKYKKF